MVRGGRTPIGAMTSTFPFAKRWVSEEDEPKGTGPFSGVFVAVLLTASKIGGCAVASYRNGRWECGSLFFCLRSRVRMEHVLRE